MRISFKIHLSRFVHLSHHNGLGVVVVGQKSAVGRQRQHGTPGFHP